MTIVIGCNLEESKIFCFGGITKRGGGVWLLAALKPINRPGWWKGKLALFQMSETGGRGG